MTVPTIRSGRKSAIKASSRTALFFAGVILFAASTCALAHTDVTPQQAHDLIDSASDLTIVDVREPYEYCDAGGHIPGALNYPWSSGVLRARFEELPTDGPILVVCRSGGRSNAAASFLDSSGFSQVYDMMGGMSSWQWETEPCGEPEPKYSGGSGAVRNPYQIATAEDLITLGETPDDYDKHFVLTADIDLDPNLPGGKVFDAAVIAPDVDTDKYLFQGTAFSGVFDGDGHTISHLTITGVSYLGLFGELASGAEVKDLGVIDVNISGSGDVVGGLLGHDQSGAIVIRCYSTGTVSGDDNVGGLVGSNGGYMTQCYSTGTVSGNYIVAGLLGANEGNGLVADCYSTGAVNGYDAVAGLVGFNLGEVTHCCSAGTVTGDQRVGGLVGWTYGSIASSFWDIQTSGQTNMCGIQEEGATGCDDSFGKTTAEMQMAGTFLDSGWDFVDEMDNGPNDIWKISEGLDYPRLWWEKYGGGTGEPNDPYRIYTAEHLNELGAERDDYNKHFKLMADIDFAGYFYDRAVIAPDMNDSGLQHEGIPFTGVLDGNGRAISNLTIEGHSYLGLFGYLDSDAIISNLSIEATDVNGVSDFVGSLAGFSYGNVIGCNCTGDVSGNDNVGGLVGSNSIGANMINCRSTVTVSGNEKVGGLVGYTKGSVAMCYSTGMVISEGQNAGGFVGEKDPSYGIVIDCFWDIQTSGRATSAGGTGKTTAKMQTAGTFLDAGWDFVDETANGTEDIWWILKGQDYPRLWWETAGR